MHWEVWRMEADVLDFLKEQREETLKVPSPVGDAVKTLQQVPGWMPH